MNLQIVHYQPEYRQAFRELNEAWIKQYFKIEESDRKALGDPQGYILYQGGFILVALEGEAVVGVCAMIAMPGNPGTFELAKMAVAPSTQGKGVGYKLGMAVIEEARQRGAEKVYLESNTVLVPAIALYRKLGFKETKGYASPYERCNIQMEIRLEG
ncbi:GNAT family N-acetyltransferase [Zeaxanthinibacter sp. PT1]|uniref:GNAT family N-acetyltransferase n=1 Tax=Zeaxanthinibacter TaxID=561554 RepID=UPI00234A5896|nr:GNAT family N-acetyltransferase [Zeaxanthinibacter sp. PT1]MDC6351055.1 GNAT family N-acetyltransferase [Zeaxanthinibacter sp. PT1]